MRASNNTENKEKQIIWTTELVKEAAEKLNDGYILKRVYNPFFNNIIGLRRGGLTFKMSQFEVDEYIKCASDIIYFAEKYCYVKGEEGEPIKITLRDYQHEILNNFSNYRFNILCASRQIGKSVMSGITIIHFILFNNHKNALITANTLDTVIEIINKISEIYQHLPFFLQMGIKNWNQKSIVLDNKSRIKGFATTKTSSVGQTADLTFMDEFSKISDNIKEKFYKTVFPTISNIENSKVIITSTPDGYELFHKLLTDAEKPEGDPQKNNFKPYRVYWWQVPKRFVTYVRIDRSKTLKFKISTKEILNHLISKYPKNEIETKFNKEIGKDVINIFNNQNCSEEDIQKEEINGVKLVELADITTWKKETIKDIGGEEAFNQEFDLRFINTARNLLDESLIEELFSNKKEFKYEPIDSFDTKLKFSYQDLKWIQDDEIFSSSQKKDLKIIISVDVAEGLGQDYSVINIFKVSPKNKDIIDVQKESYNNIVDFFKLQQIGMFRSNLISVQQLAEILYLICFEYFDSENVKVVLELNTYGAEVIAHLPHVFDGNNDYGSSIFLKYKHRVDSIEEKIGIKIGDNKNLLVKDYQEKMQSRSIVISDETNITEITTFIKHVTSAGNVQFSADGGSHDDTVMTVVNAASVFKKSDFRQIIEEFAEKMPDKELYNYINGLLNNVEPKDSIDYGQILSIRKQQMLLKANQRNANKGLPGLKDWYGRS